MPATTSTSSNSLLDYLAADPPGAARKAPAPPAAENTELQRMHDYARGVLDGSVRACEKVKMACRRFYADLKRSEEDPDWPWVFDPEKAVRPIRFMERYLTPSKGDYDKFTLMPWQCFCEANLYGWVHRETGLRRFNEGLIAVGRGNGKTTLLSGNAAFGVCKDDERGADVYLLANSKEQAAITFNECSTQIKDSRIASKFRVLKSAIYYDRTNGCIQHRASDSRKLDGLNPQMAIFDELHGYRDFKLINVIKRGMNKRRQPLAIYITTMGTVLDGPLMHYYQLFTDAMIPGKLREDVADRMFAFICELDADDDVEDTDNWIKANPSIGTLLDLEQLKADWERCKHIPQERSDFICKQLNVFTNNGEAKFVDFEVLQRNSGVIDENSLIGRECYGGFDLSLTEDFTAAALEFPLDDGRIFWLGHTWVPQKKVDADNEKIPYYEWALQGLLTIVDGEYVRYELIYDWFCKAAEQYDIMSIGYDPANAMRLVQQLESKGLPVHAVRQGPLTLNGPMKNMREVLLDGNLVFNGNPLCRWYLDNIKIRQGVKDAEHENWLPTKAGRYAKIDGYAALLDAHAEMLRLRPAGQVFDGDGVRFIAL